MIRMDSFAAGEGLEVNHLMAHAGIAEKMEGAEEVEATSVAEAVDRFGKVVRAGRVDG